MDIFLPGELHDFFSTQPISCRTQSHRGLHKDPRCAERPEFLQDAATQLINQRDGWLIRHTGTPLHMCDPGQGACKTAPQVSLTTLTLLSHAHTHADKCC